MRSLAALLTVLATPALAHHEVVVATSMMPLMGGLAVIALSCAAAVRKRFRKK